MKIKKILKRIIIICFTISICTSPLKAEENDYPTRNKNTIGIGIYLLGPEVFTSIIVDYFFSPTLNVELGFGQNETEETVYPFFSNEKITNRWTEKLAHLGLKYYLYGKSKTSGWSPYIGILPGMLIASPKQTHFSSNTGKYETYNFNISAFRLIIPIGMEYVGTSGFTFAADVEYIYVKNAEMESVTSDGVKHSDTLLFTGISTFWFGIKIGWHF